MLSPGTRVAGYPRSNRARATRANGGTGITTRVSRGAQRKPATALTAEQRIAELELQLERQADAAKTQAALYRISELASRAEALDDFYGGVHGILAELMYAENIYLALFDEERRQINFAYWVDSVDTDFPDARQWDPMGEGYSQGLTGYVLRANKPLLVDAAMNARKQRVGDKVTFKGFKGIRYVESGEPAATWLGVPLSVQGKSMGVMAVQDYRDGQAYGEEEKKILAFVATQTALAIDRKRAQQALRESEQKFRALFEGSSQGVMIHDEEKFLEVNSATLRMLKSSGPATLRMNGGEET